MWPAGSVAPQQACGTSSAQGWNPCTLHWQVDSYLLGHQGSPWGILFKKMHHKVAGALGRPVLNSVLRELVENAGLGIKPLSPFSMSSPGILL